MAHLREIRTDARIALRAASRWALQGLQTSSSSSALEWFLWKSERAFFSPQFLQVFKAGRAGPGAAEGATEDSGTGKGTG